MDAVYQVFRKRFLEFDLGARICGPFSDKSGVIARDPRGFVVAVPAGQQPARGRRTRICAVPVRLSVESGWMTVGCEAVPEDVAVRGTPRDVWGRLWARRSSFTRWEARRTELDPKAFRLEVEELDPPDTWFDSAAVVQPDVCQGDLLTVHTKWMATLPDLVESEVMFDGQPYEHLQVIHTETLPLGVHQFDFRAVFADGQERSCAWTFSLVSKVELRALEPMTDLRLGDPKEPNGVALPLLAINRAPHPVLVELAVAGVPSGWSAAVLGDALLVLEPEESREVTLQVEIMNDAGIDARPLPFTVGATSVVPVEHPGEQPHALTSFATCYVRLAADPEWFKAAAVLNHLLRVEGAPILYGQDPKG